MVELCAIIADLVHPYSTGWDLLAFARDRNLFFQQCTHNTRHCSSRAPPGCLSNSLVFRLRTHRHGSLVSRELCVIGADLVHPYFTGGTTFLCERPKSSVTINFTVFSTLHNNSSAFVLWSQKGCSWEEVCLSGATHQHCLFVYFFSDNASNACNIGTATLLGGAGSANAQGARDGHAARWSRQR